MNFLYTCPVTTAPLPSTKHTWIEFGHTGQKVSSGRHKFWIYYTHVLCQRHLDHPLPSPKQNTNFLCNIGVTEHEQILNVLYARPLTTAPGSSTTHTQIELRDLLEGSRTQLKGHTSGSFRMFNLLSRAFSKKKVTPCRAFRICNVLSSVFWKQTLEFSIDISVSHHMHKLWTSYTHVLWQRHLSIFHKARLNRIWTCSKDHGACLTEKSAASLWYVKCSFYDQTQ